MSGQSTTINALYEYYDHQFSNAGSPTKVEETVGCGLLPAHIEYTTPDVASLFKKILIGLPGGLLGSLELFEVLRDILLNLGPNLELSDSENTLLRAKLIALAILSVTSTYRVYLIQAVSGLAAYFGSEAEKAEAADAATAGQELHNQPKSELMGYQSLGVVLGPLLLGNLTDKIDVSVWESQESAPRTSTDSTKRSKKQKRNSAPSKIEKDATLSAHVDRANLTASIMQLLLLIWKDVVRQLREISGSMSASWQTRSSSQIKTIPSRAGSRLTMNSDEDMLFLDILRGQKLPEEFKNGAIMKRKVRISSKSPMSRGVTKTSREHQPPQQPWQPAANEEQGGESPSYASVIESIERSFGQLTEPDNPASKEEHVTSKEAIDPLDHDKRTYSDIAMDEMAMGTILPDIEDTPAASPSKKSPRQASFSDTPRGRGRQRSSSEVPETAFKIVHLQNISQTLPPTPKKLQPCLDKPLPPIGGVQRAELSSRNSEDDATGALRRVLLQSRPSRRPEDIPSFSTRNPSPTAIFPARHGSPNGSLPPRQSSLPAEAPLPMKPLETYESIAEYRSKSDAYMSPPNVSHLRKASEAQLNKDELPHPGEKRSSVKFLAQKFAETSRVTRKEGEASEYGNIPTVYAIIKPLPPPDHNPLEDPFITLLGRTPSPEKESLIPKPVLNVGRGRKAESRSPSPSKQATPGLSHGKRSSVYNFVLDQDAEIVKRNTIDLSQPPIPTKRDLSSLRPDQLPASVGQYLCSRPLPTFSTEPLCIASPTVEEPPMEHHITKRVSTLARSESPKRSSSPSRLRGFPNTEARERPNSYFDASDGLKALERHGSMNATLYNEICRLQRLLEQKGEEVQAARRGLDAVRDTYKEGGVADERKGSWTKGKLDDEVRVAREEMGVWKRRAQWAEEQLRGLGGLAGIVAQAGDESSEGESKQRKDSGVELVEKKGRGMGMEVEVKVWGNGDEGAVTGNLDNDDAVHQRGG